MCINNCENTASNVDNHVLYAKFKNDIIFCLQVVRHLTSVESM